MSEEYDYELELDPKLFNPIYWHVKEALLDESIRFVMIMGGSSAGKTYEITNGLITDSLERKKNTFVSRKVSTEIKDTIYPAFKGIVDKYREYLDLFDDTEFNIYINESHLRFKGLDDPGKIKGLEGYDRLFLNELTAYSESDFKEIRRRLRGKAGQQIICDWNPIDRNHWIKKNFLNNYEFIDLPLNIKGNPYSQLDKKFSKKQISKDGRILLIKVTYRDNKWVTGAEDGTGYKDVHALAEFNDMKQNNPDDYKVYGLDDWGVLTDRLIFTNWEVIDEIPKEAKKVPCGMDFGFSPDPTTLIDVRTWTDPKGRSCLVLDEMLWETGLVTVDTGNELDGGSIEAKLKEIGFDKMHRDIIADNENRTVTELMLAGYSIYPAKKGPDSIIPGLKMMKSYYIYITKSSVHLISEFEGYKRQIDNNGTILPKPIHKNCHGIDGARYSIQAKNMFW